MGETNNTNGTSSTTHPTGTPASGGTPVGGNVMNAISTFETTLSSLKALYSEQQFAQAKLQQQEIDLTMREQEIEERASQLDGLRSTIERDRQTLDGMKTALAEQQNALDAKTGEVARVAETLKRRTDEIDDSARALTELERRTREEARLRQAAVDKRAAELETQHQALSQSQSDLRNLILENEKKRSEIAAEFERLTHERQQIDSAKAEIAQAKADLARAKDAIDAARTEVARREAQLASSGDVNVKAAAALTALRDELAQAQLDAEQKDVELKQVRAQFAAMQTNAGTANSNAGAHSAGLAEARATIDRLSASLTEKTGRVRELENEVAALREGAGGEMTSPIQFGESDAALTGQLEQAQNEVQQLRERLERIPNAGDGSREEGFLARRRERLAKYRFAVRQQADKVRKGQAALRKRFEACEQLLAQRAELSAAHAAITEYQRKMQKRRASGGVAVAALCTTLSLAVLAGLSWAVAREVTPGTFAVTTQLTADTHGRDLSGAELAEWQRFHEELVLDPRFYERVAQRMQRRGIATLSQASAVAERMRTDFTVSSSANGEVNMELRGKGAQKTERELDTIASTLASEANAARGERADGASTTPPSPAKASGRPLDDTQLYTAGGIFGGGTLIGMMLGTFAWRRLASAKTRFEADASISQALDESKWPDPRKDGA